MVNGCEEGIDIGEVEKTRQITVYLSNFKEGGIFNSYS